MENLLFYKHGTGVLFVEGFAEKFLFSFQGQSCPRLFRTLPLTLLRKTAAYKYCTSFFFLKSCLQSLCVCNCLGNRVFNPSHIIPLSTHPTVCLKCVFRPSFTNSPRLWATFCHLRRFSGTCCLEAPFQALQLCNHQHSKLFWLVA